MVRNSSFIKSKLTFESSTFACTIVITHWKLTELSDDLVSPSRFWSFLDSSSSQWSASPQHFLLRRSRCNSKHVVRLHILFGVYHNLVLPSLCGSLPVLRSCNTLPPSPRVSLSLCDTELTGRAGRPHSSGMFTRFVFVLDFCVAARRARKFAVALLLLAHIWFERAFQNKSEFSSFSLHATQAVQFPDQTITRLLHMNRLHKSSSVTKTTSWQSYPFLRPCLARKTELEKVENLEKGWENSQHSQSLNNVSQGFQFLKVSVKNTRVVSHVFIDDFLKVFLCFQKALEIFSQGTKWCPGRPVTSFRKQFYCVDTVSQCLKHFLNPFLTPAEVFLKGM